MERETGRVDIEALVPSWIIYSEGGRRTQLDLAIKRVIDIVASLILLLVTLPLMAVAALLVGLTSKGPVLFRQTRVGQFGNDFQLLKFRSMRAEMGRRE